MQIRSRSNLTILTIIVTVGVLMATLSTTIASMPIARAQSENAHPPIGAFGNPNDLSTGPPIPTCNAIDQGNFHGPPDDPRVGCKVSPP